MVCDVTYPNGATKTRKLNAHAQVRPSYLTTPAGKTWSINRIYYTPTVNGVTYTTNVMGNLIYENIDRTFSYAYNGSGNISKITDKTGTVSKESTFVYDEANQLIRENNAYTNKTVTYTYDAGGNILTKTEYPYTTGTLDGLTGTVVNYTYGNTNWKDLLTEFNGNAITYDQIGNPLTYYNGTTFTWERGRKLATATTADGTSISYKYNDSGIRTQKTVNGTATDYFLDGSKIIAEKTNGNTTWFYYDGDGTREAIEYKGNVYYYFYNAQGDVMGLYDNNLNVVVNYTYDSWGNTVSVTGSMADTLGQDNPFRYRGYYFDSDTGLYYLNSRYYDANTGRFINADGLVQTGQGLLDKNMFAYCMNNPIIFCDPSGCQPEYYTVIIPINGGGPITVPPGYTYTSTMGSDGIYTYTVSPIINPQAQLAIAQTIYGEGGGRYAHSDWKEGQRAVATIIVNRVQSSNFPNDFESVCSQNAQFNGYVQGKKAYESGCYDTIMWDNAMLLAEDIVSGNFTSHPDMNSDYLYFHSESYGNADTIARIKQKSEVVIAGGNMFYINWP